MFPSLSHHDIYDAALDDELFDALPKWMGEKINAPSAMFVWLHPGNLPEIIAGTQPETNSSYEELFAKNPWIAHATDDKIGLGGTRMSNYVSASEFENSAYYREFILKHRLERFWCLGLLQHVRGGRVATAFHKGKNAGDFTDHEVSLINRHVDDLGRLHAIRRELHRASIGNIIATNGSLLDDAPTFELDHRGHLQRMNAKADHLFRLHPHLGIDSRRKLRVWGAAQGAFRLARRQATEARKSRAGAVDLPQIRAIDGRIIPAMRFSFLPRSNGGRRALVVATSAVVGRMKDLFEAPQERLPLTPRERDVLQGLIEGLRRDQLAHKLEVAVPTIDLHSANLRLKLGARTLVEAVAIALKLGLL